MPFPQFISTILVIALFASCSFSLDGGVSISQEQLERLNPSASVLTTPDATRCLTINVNPLFEREDFDFMSLVSDIRFVPLQTTTISKIGKPDRLIVTDSHIYISDSKAVFIFDNVGRFIRKIPFLTSRPHDFAIDRRYGEIFVCADGYVRHYTAEGEHLWSDQFPFRFNSIAASNDMLILHCDSNNMNTHLPANVASAPCLVINRQGALVRHLAPLVSHTPMLRGLRRLQPMAEGVVMSHSFCDTIFNIVDDEIRARYVLDYSQNQLFDPAVDGVTRKSTGVYFYGGDIVGCQGGIYFRLRSDRANMFRCFYDAHSGKIAGGVQPIADYCQMPPLYNPMTSIGDNYVSLFHPYQTESGATFRFTGDKVSENEKDKLEGVRHDDNPVVVFFRIHVN